jgi:hypothetical protein
MTIRTKTNKAVQLVKGSEAAYATYLQKKQHLGEWPHTRYRAQKLTFLFVLTAPHQFPEFTLCFKQQQAQMPYLFQHQQQHIVQVFITCCLLLYPAQEVMAPVGIVILRWNGDTLEQELAFKSVFTSDQVASQLFTEADKAPLFL